MKKTINKRGVERIPPKEVNEPIVGSYKFEPIIGTYGEWIFKEKSSK